MNNAHTSYAAQLETLRLCFAGEVASQLAEYGNSLRARGVWGDKLGASWEYAHARNQDGTYRTHSYQDDGISIWLRFAYNENQVEVAAQYNGLELTFERKFPADTCPSTIGLALGAHMERHLTGRVCYGRGECD